MHHKDHELAESCWTQLKEGHSKSMSAAEVQKIGMRMVATANNTAPHDLSEMARTREDAANAVSALAMELSDNSDAVAGTWDIAIDLTHRWLEATK
jgi:hypothetical protein